LSIEEARDVIELPLQGNIDISGWDLRKALRLFRKSNPVLMEWLVSPLVYEQRGSFAERLRDLAVRHHSRQSAAYHYLHMAEGNHRAYLAGKKKVNLKKYLYVLRPLVAILWLREHEGLAPMSFVDALNAVPVPVRSRKAIAKLLATKSRSSELGTGTPIAAIDEFIKTATQEARDYCESAPVGQPSLEDVNALFRSALKETWT
jgi:predicted nucleotidyltransferase